ncbi:MAG: hypothetical protein ACPGJS_01950 [Flammeovirgaceae bacterium]
MSNKPQIPIILIDESTGFLDLVESHDMLSSSSVLGFIKETHKRFRAYDKNGICWGIGEVKSDYKINRLTKLLAYTFYNPEITITLTWTELHEYTLADLKKKINQQIKRDDDVITQFEEGEIIIQKINNCNSFDAIVTALEKYVFKVDEEQLWKEQEARNKNIYKVK